MIMTTDNWYPDDHDQINADSGCHRKHAATYNQTTPIAAGAAVAGTGSMFRHACTNTSIYPAIKTPWVSHS
jgi:hypothetical protein